MRRRCVRIFVHHQGRRLGEQIFFVPANARHSRPRAHPRVFGRARADARHGGVPAVSPRHCRRWAFGGAHDEDGEAREHALFGRAADERQPTRARVSRPRTRRAGTKNDAAHGHRRAVRRQIFLPRRARGATTASRGLAAGRHWRFLRGGPPSAREDYARRRVSGTTRNQPGALSARAARERVSRRSGERGFEPPAGRSARATFHAAGEDAARAQRHAGGGARYRARQSARTTRTRRADAGLLSRTHHLLRRPREDAGGHAVGFLRPHHRRAHGRVPAGVHAARRQPHHARRRATARSR